MLRYCDSLDTCDVMLLIQPSIKVEGIFAIHRGSGLRSLGMVGMHATTESLAKKDQSFRSL